MNKELKALKIIKTKKVNMYDLNRVENVSDYNFYTLEYYQELTKKEFKLLKEILK